MSLFFSFIFSFLIVGIGITIATIPEAEVYWNNVLPNTAMPSSMYELLYPKGEELSSSSSKPNPRPPPKYFDYSNYAMDYSPTSISSPSRPKPKPKTPPPAPAPIPISFVYSEYAKDNSQNKIATPPPTPFPSFNYDYAKKDSSFQKVDPPPSPIPGFNYGYAKNEIESKIDSLLEKSDPPSPFPGFNYGYAKNEDRPKKDLSLEKADPPSPFPGFNYGYAKEEFESEINEPPSPIPILPFGYDYLKNKKVGKKKVASSGVFFLEESLIPDSKFNFVFPPANSKNILLPRKIAESIPFSSKEVPLILSLFSINPNSNQARDLSTTLRLCESPTIPNEVKACVTSLESMVEFVMSALQTRDITVTSSDLPKVGLSKKEYTVSKVNQIGEEANYVACHDEMYPYKLFRCHTTGPARAYMVMMSAEDGTTIELASICHLDTSFWNPNHVSFKILGVKPGGKPVCHIMPYGHFLWGPNKKISQI